MRINGNLVFNSDASGEIQHAYIERLSSAPAFNAAQKGRLYFNTTTSLFYYNDGSAWVPFATGGNATALQTEVDNVEAALGASINGDGTFNAAGFSGATYITSPTSVTNAIMQLDASLNANNTLAELDDVTITGLQNKDVLYFDITSSTWKNAPAGATSNVQPYDAGLTSVSSLTGPGFVTVSADGDVFTARSLVAPAAGLSITATDGSGNPTFALTNDLAAVEGLASTGIAVRTATDTWTTRTLTAGTTGTIVIGDGSGVAGAPTFDLETLTIPTNGGAFSKFNYDTYGRVTSTQAVVAADITALVDATYVNVAGDTMTGSLNMGGNVIASVGTPVAGTDATNKNYVDAAVTGLTWKNSVRVATDTNVDLTTGGLLTVDGITLVDGDRVLVKGQTDAAQNGVYVVSAGAWIRAADADTAAEFAALTVLVTEGTVYGDTGWTQTAEVATLGTTAVTFVQFTGAGTYTAGTGLSLTANTFSVNLGAGIVDLPTGEVGIDLYPAGALILTTDGSASSTSTSSQLHLKLDGSTLTQGANGLKIAAGGVTEVEINSSARDSNGGLTGGSGSKLAVNVDGTSLTIGSNVVSVKDDGITTIKILDGNVTNAKLANDSITIAGDLGSNDSALGTTLTVTGANGISTTSTAGTLEVTLTAGLNELSDVQVGGEAAGETLVFTANAGFVNRKIYHLYESSGANTTHTVTHAIGQKYCNVTVVDSTDEVVIPQSITFDSDTALTVSFTSAIDCKVIVMGVNAAN